MTGVIEADWHALEVVIDPMDGKAFIEFHRNTPMVNVIATVQVLEKDRGLAFDLLDEGLWEHHGSMVRLHAMFKEQLTE